MNLEKWSAIASLGLFVMFAGEMILLYNFMASPDEDSMMEWFEADPKILQFISIGVAPASIMATVSFILSRRYGSRQNGAFIASGGAAMLGGMAYCQLLLDRVPGSISTDALYLAPPVFMAVSVAVVAAGLRLFKTKKRRPKKDYLSS